MGVKRYAALLAPEDQHARPEGERAEPEAWRLQPEAWRLEREGFTWLGFLLPVPWLLFKRLWLTALVAFLIPMAASFALGPIAGLVASVAVSLVVGFEGRGWRIDRFERNGWVWEVTIPARGRAEAEDRLAWMVTQGEAMRDREMGGQATPPRPVIGPISGPLAENVVRASAASEPQSDTASEPNFGAADEPTLDPARTRWADPGNRRATVTDNPSRPFGLLPLGGR